VDATDARLLNNAVCGLSGISGQRLRAADTKGVVALQFVPYASYQNAQN
jgi:hypothetical protein